ncbi:MAG: hypothetical protein LBM92_00295, partial [Opitutaceae bacterium]|nr:hypothetical protein [Opitutaceae bacterium]
MSFPKILLVFIAALGLQLPAFPAAASSASARAADWRAFDDAAARRLPKDASAALDRVINSAMADRAWPEAVKAILQKIQTDASVESQRDQAAHAIRALETWLGGAASQPVGSSGAASQPSESEGLPGSSGTGAPPVGLRVMGDSPMSATAETAAPAEAAAAQSPAPRPALPPEMRPLLEAALAKTWWAYYEANRWQLLQRTRTAAAPSDDFLTWDAPRVLAEAARHFDAALADPAALQRAPVSAFEPLLEKGALPDAHRPALYDFLVHEAIAFYSAGEQGVPRPADRFDPDADSPLLGELEEFLAWQPGSRGTGGSPASPDPILRALQLYQQLLRFHQPDRDKTALADADLARLNWAAAVLGQPACERHQAALRAFIKRWKKLPVATEACLDLANFFDEQNPDDMRAAALEGVRLHPSAPAANACRNIIASIEAPALVGISTERTWAEPQSGILVGHRNLKKIYFRAIPINWEENITGKIPAWDSDEFKLASRVPAKTWSVSLPATADFKTRVEKSPAPRDLEPGFYVIAASINKAFSDKNNIVLGTGVWVSDLAIVSDHDDGSQISGFVVDANTGEPVSGAVVTAWDDLHRVKSCDATTGAQGEFMLTPVVAGKQYRRFHLRARTTGGREIATEGNVWAGNARGPSEEFTRDHIYFFTDRSFYRPGQSIHFKAVVLRASNTYTSHSLLTAHDITVMLRDPNGKTAGTLKL